MTLEEVLKNIEHYEYTPPCESTLSILPKGKDRSTALSNLTALDDKKCVWCRNSHLVGRRRKYCSVSCKNSAMMFCYPQDPRTKAWVLINRQGCACRLCGLSHEDLIIENYSKALKSKERYETFAEKYGYTQKFTISYWHLMGTSSGHILQADHIVPIFKGGSSLGIDNIQVVCAACHSIKTAAERNM